MKTLNIKSILFVLSSYALSLSGCQTQVKEVNPSDRTPTFSISAGQSDPLRCEVVGEMPDCKVFWTVHAGILTHRQMCDEKQIKYTPLVLNAMAKSLSDSCQLKIKFVRMTSKDDVPSEERLAKMMSQSKLWKRYAKAPAEKRKKFSEAFLKKVVDQKDLFSDVITALNSVNYKFKLAKVDVAQFSPMADSRHFNTLRKIKVGENFVVPQNLRLVWINSKNIPKKIRENPNKPVDSKVEAKKPIQLPTELPDKEVF